MTIYTVLHNGKLMRYTDDQLSALWSTGKVTGSTLDIVRTHDPKADDRGRVVNLNTGRLNLIPKAEQTQKRTQTQTTQKRTQTRPIDQMLSLLADDDDDADATIDDAIKVNPHQQTQKRSGAERPIADLIDDATIADLIKVNPGADASILNAIVFSQTQTADRRADALRSACEEDDRAMLRVLARYADTEAERTHKPQTIAEYLKASSRDGIAAIAVSSLAPVTESGIKGKMRSTLRAIIRAYGDDPNMATDQNWIAPNSVSLVRFTEAEQTLPAYAIIMPDARDRALVWTIVRSKVADKSSALIGVMTAKAFVDHVLKAE